MAPPVPGCAAVGRPVRVAVGEGALDAVRTRVDAPVSDAMISSLRRRMGPRRRARTWRTGSGSCRVSRELNPPAAMLHYSDEPYRFFPPKPAPWLILGAREINRRYILPRERRVDRVEVSCPDRVREAWRRGDRVLFAPNHPSHSDPQTMFEAYRQLRLRSMFMAAYDAFYSSRRRRWMLQRLGVFSVDRETSDKQALGQAVRTLVEGRYALTIFPEGNVYLQNDWVTPFQEGAFFVACRALQSLRKDGWEGEILVCPVSLKFTHMTDCRPQLREMLHQAAAAANTEFDEAKDHIGELRRIGAMVLRKTLRQRGVKLPEEAGEALPDLIPTAAGSLLAPLEEKIGLEPGSDDTLLDRIRAVRRAVHRIRIDPARAADHDVAVSWANEAMTALRILTYTGRYLDEPTLDRFAETTEKLTEDIFSRMGTPYAPRCAYVRVADPVRLSEFLGEDPGPSRDATSSLARWCETRVQEGIDAINAANPHPGGKAYVA